MTSKSSSHPEGLRIARERIQHESVEKTGVLNLSGLGLAEFPEELFELGHLRELALGRSPKYKTGRSFMQIIIDGRFVSRSTFDVWIEPQVLN